MYQADETRYDKMQYRRCGRSGILLPLISLGLWQNFGLEKPLEEQKKIIFRAFDLGITHFDLANNYGMPARGLAEENFGKILHEDMAGYREQMMISTKAGYDFWPGPYGNWGSRKYLMSSLDASLKRMKLDYVDIFYHHRPDPETPLEETMGALADMVRQGKALYVGISNYKAEEAAAVADAFVAEQSNLSTREQLVNYALQFVGGRYKFGGSDPHTGVDCSGFTKYVMQHGAGVSLNRSSTSQSKQGTAISADQMQPGDLIFYGSGRGINHVAMYIGDGKVVHASTERTGIKTSPWNYRTPVKIVNVLG